MKKKRIANKEQARAYLRKMRDADLKRRISEIKEAKKEKKRGGLEPIEKLKFDMRDIYFSNWDKNQLKMIYEFCEGLNKTVNERTNEIQTSYLKRLDDFFDSIKKNSKFAYGSEFMDLTISEININRLNELGKDGWHYNFEHNGKYFLSRNIYLKNLKKKGV